MTADHLGRVVAEGFLGLAVRELDLAVETDLKNGVARVFDEQAVFLFFAWGENDLLVTLL